MPSLQSRRAGQRNENSVRRASILLAHVSSGGEGGTLRRAASFARKSQQNRVFGTGCDTFTCTLTDASGQRLSAIAVKRRQTRRGRRVPRRATSSETPARPQT